MDLLRILLFGMITGSAGAFFMSLLMKWEIIHWFNRAMGTLWKNIQWFPRITFCLFCASFWTVALIGLIHALFATVQYEFWEYILSIPIATLISVYCPIPYQKM